MIEVFEELETGLCYLRCTECGVESDSMPSSVIEEMDLVVCPGCGRTHAKQANQEEAGG